ncbi:MAG TPA: hypothetical protein VLJ86_20790 [Ramlibacter sp.]|nr:hypothetical protein [Ramlibacter sp.]
MASKLSIGNALAELRRRQETDLERRRHGTNLLPPDALRPGAKSAIGVLMTTLGGQMRPITAQDLVQFRRNITALGDRVAKGITLQELVDASRPEDLERAREEIRHALPTRLTEGDVLMTTSSGPHSKVTRHVVHFVFDNYGAAVARPVSPPQAAQWLAREGRVRLECTCERFTFWYRAVATYGGFVAGRPETGFPKQRNPHLIGVGCKHILRAARELSSPFGRTYLAKMIAADRARLDAKKSPARPKVITASRTQADAELSAQSRRTRSISTTDERQRRALAASIRQAMPKGPAGTVQRDLAQTLARLKERPDVTAQSILAALQSVLDRPAKGAT